MVMRAVLDNHETPGREGLSVSISDEMWGSWVRCWDRDPRKRPSALDVLESLPDILKQSVTKPRLNVDVSVIEAALPTPISKMNRESLENRYKSRGRRRSLSNSQIRRSIDDLSDEQLRDIFFWVVASGDNAEDDLGSVRLVCRRWRRIVSNEHEYIFPRGGSSYKEDP